ncbi:MAG: helix-turn-helix domain-containing protein [Acidimicrobiales bacterium]
MSRTTTAPRTRAAALPPEERRAAIVAATLPLLREHGTALTTRQIARAAGIAEGTIFRVFHDKDELLGAAVEAAMDPAPTAAAIRGVDLGLPLEARLAAAVGILQRRVADLWQVMNAAGVRVPPGDQAARRRRDAPDLLAVAALVEPDRQRIDRDPLDAAIALRSLTFACTHPALVVGEPSTPAEIVALLLDGIRTRRG